MLKSSSKIKKSRDGTIFREVKEHYLRKEIPCGIKGCFTCKEYPNIEVLDPTNEGTSSIFPTNHILIPDASTFITQMDLFENDLLTNIIVLKSVLNQIKAENIGILRRIEAVLRISEKCFYLFNNEFHLDTFLTRNVGESESDWNLRLFFKAVQWYNEHIRNISTGISIISISNINFSNLYNISNINNDKYNISNIYNKNEISIDISNDTSNDSYNTASIFDYINSLSFYDELVDVLVIDESLCGDLPSLKALESHDAFSEHIPLSHLNIGIRSGKYLSGIYYQNADDYLSGTVFLKNAEETVKILGLECINRAFTGDVVAIEAVGKVPDLVDEVRIDDGSDLMLRKIEKLRDVGNEKFYRVVGIVRRNWKQYCGVIVKNVSDNLFLFKPMDSRIPFILFESKRIKSLENCKICLAVDQWPKNLRYPRGHFVKSIGDIKNIATETESILFERRIPYSKFSKSVLDCLPNITDEISRINLPEWRVDSVLKSQPERVDLRHLNICSIDPPGCTDIDDALHIRLADSNETREIYEIGVHIADVTHYVLPGTPIDKEAFRRGTTVYLVDKRVDMLPELLSSNLCSLRSHEDRLAFSMICYIDSNGDLCDVPVQFMKSVIRSRRAFTYYEAQNMIDDPKDTSELAVMLRKLMAVTKKMRERRMKNGALQLDSPELQSELDSETNDPVGFRIKESVDTNKLVEECMLLANILVAKKIYHAFPTISMLRCHPSPEMGKVCELYDIVNKRFGYNETPATCRFSDFLEKAANPNDPLVNKIVRLMSILCLKQAVYICSGKSTFENFHHFGLSEDIYTHFTSPIRRYPDIIVHRLLAASIGASNSQVSILYNIESMHQMCEHLNRRHTAARIAGRESTKLFLYTYLRKIPQTEMKPTRGYMTKVLNNALAFYIPEHHHLGFIKFDPDACKKFGTIVRLQNGKVENKNSGICISLFDYVTIQIKINHNVYSSDGLNFEIIEPVIPGISK